MEVGGGGHSMSDLWGLRDAISQRYGRRYCSYDLPGVGWSDYALTDQPIITEQVLPFIAIAVAILRSAFCTALLYLLYPMRQLMFF